MKRTERRHLKENELQTFAREARQQLEERKRADAQQTFNRIVEEYPESPYSGDARKELDNLKKAA
jgi:outer membrane protein assembly factor BamD (BamD/ComL family)